MLHAVICQVPFAKFKLIQHMNIVLENANCARKNPCRP